MCDQETKRNRKGLEPLYPLEGCDSNYLEGCQHFNKRMSDAFQVNLYMTKT